MVRVAPLDAPLGECQLPAAYNAILGAYRAGFFGDLSRMDLHHGRGWLFVLAEGVEEVGVRLMPLASQEVDRSAPLVETSIEGLVVGIPRALAAELARAERVGVVVLGAHQLLERVAGQGVIYLPLLKSFVGHLVVKVGLGAEHQRCLLL